MLGRRFKAACVATGLLVVAIYSGHLLLEEVDYLRARLHPPPHESTHVPQWNAAPVKLPSVDVLPSQAPETVRTYQ